jgi:hypothetical protein
VVAEIALTLVVLEGATLTLVSYRNLQSMDLGFSPNHVLSLQIALSRTKYPGATQVGTLFKNALDRVRTIPGVDGAALVSGLPMLDRTVDLTTQDFTVEGHPLATGLANAGYRIASKDYFDVMGAHLVRGRLFTD